jgi:hypothetical protein
MADTEPASESKAPGASPSEGSARSAGQTTTRDSSSAGSIPSTECSASTRSSRFLPSYTHTPHRTHRTHRTTQPAHQGVRGWVSGWTNRRVGAADEAVNAGVVRKQRLEEVHAQEARDAGEQRLPAQFLGSAFHPCRAAPTSVTQRNMTHDTRQTTTNLA